MIVGTILCWSIGPILIRSVKDVFPVSFQNFGRYLVSLAVIWPASFLSARRGDAGVFLRRPLVWRILAIAAANFAFQATFTWGLYLVMPALFSLVFKSGVVISVLLAALFFPDERRVLASAAFLAGLAASIAGVLLAMFAGSDLAGAVLGPGVLVILVSTTAWALLSNLVKKWLPGISSSRALAVVFALNAPLFLIVHLFQAGVGVPAASAAAWLTMLASGLISVGLAHYLYYRAVPVIGVSLAVTLDLVRPVVVAVLSFLAFGERLAPLQAVGGALLLGGSYLAIRARFREGSAA